MRIGLTELLVIIIVALALIKPDKLGDYAKTAGQALRKFKETTKDINTQVVEPVKEAMEPLKEVVEPIKEVVEPITSLQEDINSSIEEVANGGKL